METFLFILCKFNQILPICKEYHLKETNATMRIIRISRLGLLNLHCHQLHTLELGLGQSGFPCARLVLSVSFRCLHTAESCVNSRVGDMNGAEG